MNIYKTPQLLPVLMSLLLLCLSNAPQAASVTVCAAGSEKVTYSPGLTFTSEPHETEVFGDYGGCISTSVPELENGTTFRSADSYVASCLDPLDVGQDTRTIQWNTGDTSDWDGTRTVSFVAGSIVVTVTGQIVEGLFDDSIFTLEIVFPSNPLLCLGAPGITEFNGTAVLTITEI